MQLLSVLNRLINLLFAVVMTVVMVSLVGLPLILIVLGFTGSIVHWRTYGAYNTVVVSIPLIAGGITAWLVTRAVQQGRLSLQKARQTGAVVTTVSPGIAAVFTIVALFLTALAGGDGGFSDEALFSVQLTCFSFWLVCFWIGFGYLYYPARLAWAQRQSIIATAKAWLARSSRYASWGIISGILGLLLLTNTIAVSTSGLQSVSTTWKATSYSIAGVLLAKALYYGAAWSLQKRNSQ